MLDEGRHHGGFNRFGVRGDFHFESECGELPAHGIEVRFQGEAGIRRQQREVQVFREPWQPVENAQAGTAIEGRPVEEGTALQAGQRDFLHDLAQGVPALLSRVSRQHLLDDAHASAPRHCINARNCAVLLPLAA